ncbi:3815_t:CDS:1 [Ambispora leptoticha]|uniref:3815_t:CDS:1 n=1 Tax=Ambispora leptoticha TaxID=144679 RepID=A0A9N9H4Y6_9GLOM|nr:3815_t:CDS:1 [Ambispora leptoticha]
MSLAKKYKAEEEQAKKDNTPECKKCKLRRKQAISFLTNCEGRCQECINKKQREEQKKDNNDKYVPPVDNPLSLDNSPKNNEENFPNSDEPNNSSSTPINPSSQTDNDKQKERTCRTSPERKSPHHQENRMPKGR